MTNTDSCPSYGHDYRNKHYISLKGFDQSGNEITTYIEVPEHLQDIKFPDQPIKVCKSANANETTSYVSAKVVPNTKPYYNMLIGSTLTLVILNILKRTSGSEQK